ncbi:hypothetical protein COX85_03530 [Candidatus Micrarchaeota archaeon CG_4_10_14_0_2_um_filter_55_9]|nr:MAG: hypothetical protein AUJ15_02600 [Candidatus Micrarchaeota archaeon CG1_02_55_41]PIO02608.1 MAG: hypothetical protein COT57_03100 [Candidatus Micrarchaeota archaeon CG09_land_8_20_14_0_10_55_25]PIZ91503.1 MAG: hypothetical protein COX85_03530 [Candidatus Micrarchaeota archaeon CG_4_10_14_0_2_um_filter_55_9]PJD01400.1 MAG: hypothetical protein COU38_01240 [Candidatus Micrarchaeota archaeon CG10_big_fil_rev_8_21_14_0_10_54_18]
MGDPLHPKGFLDVIQYYSLTAKTLQGFIGNKEIATKTWIHGMTRPLLKRGSKEPPLTCKDLAEAIDNKFLCLREKTLKEARGKLSKKQELAWNYFVPRKLSEFLFATNHESGNKIDLLFYDLDLGKGLNSEHGRLAALALTQQINADKEFQKECPGKMLCSWTGSSFHVFWRLNKPKHASFYHEKISWTAEGNYASKWVEAMQKELMFKVVAGHARTPDAVSVDPSQTPPGKLCRAPLGSLHVSDFKADGVSVPLKPGMLSNPGLVKELRAYTPERVLDELKELGSRLK